ncbi:hypothetical protein E1B28_012982 [Marasmius oreades]|uniref:Uncharacterized protein n=1 Tax=Marasmius oreades TaxID=181124 RepID=A0A9P7UM62_9AGAR|nr:uncharacterized protein E1B28_012982 [Marasmius oreades]KAG7087003.1 hypothetical protein E1B28_012982 [Marasmius oreades]
MAFAARFVTFFLAFSNLVSLSLAAPAPAVVCSLDQIAADVQQISTQTLALDNHVLAFPDSGGLASDAMLVHTDLQGVISAIDTTAADMEPCPAPFNDDLFQNLLSSVQTIISQESQAMNDLVAKKPAFDAVGGVSPIFKQDLDNLRASSVVLENVWLARAPADLVGQAQTLADEINNVLASAQAAYA